MNKLVKSVFMLLAITLLGIALATVTFGKTGRKLMWASINTSLQEDWGTYTYHNGTDLTAALNKNFATAKEATIRFN